MRGRLPVPSSTWTVSSGGSVTQVGGVKKSRRGRPLMEHQRAESTCSACGKTGHNARNKKKCPGWNPRDP